MLYFDLQSTLVDHFLCLFEQYQVLMSSECVLILVIFVHRDVLQQLNLQDWLLDPVGNDQFATLTDGVTEILTNSVGGERPVLRARRTVRSHLHNVFSCIHHGFMLICVTLGMIEALQISDQISDAVLTSSVNRTGLISGSVGHPEDLISLLCTCLVLPFGEEVSLRRFDDFLTTMWSGWSILPQRSIW